MSKGECSYDSPDNDLHIRPLTHLHMRSFTYITVIFLRPYRPSAVSLRTPAIGPSASTIHAASRTALIEVAPLTVRGATC